MNTPFFPHPGSASPSPLEGEGVGEGEKENIQISLNGKKIEIDAETSLQKLLEDLKLKPQMVACELNEKIVKRGAYPTTMLSEGDRIEILQMIGGG